MGNKPIVLTLTYFGKSVTVKNDTNILHSGEVMNMFKNIFIGTFGLEAWNNVLQEETNCMTTNPNSSTQESITEEENKLDPEDMKKIFQLLCNTD